ncbi:VanZ family protein [Chitinophaga silvatica]|uniref:VanZ family protein n=1 Tax=Chitinophaga silvatica TaxID=2282649 RepID=A0A3E1Y9Z1_9BACT|nr:VanZ family protein [Chitinophaga silvatica]RFS22477.1 VanZ family protein [Chitinophaga silvatica]
MKKTLYHLPAIVWISIILILCLMPGDDVPTNSFLEKIHFDKVVHFGMFGGIVFLIALGIFWQKQKVTNLTLFLLVVLAALYGFAIELMQKYWAVGRSFDLYDLLADTLGAIGGAVFFKLVIHWYKTKNSKK